MLTETNLSRFLIPYRNLQRFKFRYWLAYAEANMDINTFGYDRMEIVRSCEDIIRCFSNLIKRLPNSHRFEVIPQAKMILKGLVDFFRKEAFAIYELARSMENEVLKKARGLWRYCEGIFSIAPTYRTFRELKSLEMQIDHVSELIAGMPEFSEKRIIANSY